MDEHPARRPDRSGRPPSEDEEAAAARIRHQGTWVDLQVRRAMERGDFDDLPGYGKPIEGLGEEHDPDWWVRRLVEREQVTGVLPPSVQVRKEDEALDDRLDALPSERAVREEVTEFNARVRWALYRPPEGPPMVTPPRDPDIEVDRWRERRAARAVGTARPPTQARPGRTARWLTALLRRRART